jgi:hypothetical protein
MNSPLGESRSGTPEGVRVPLDARRAARCGGILAPTGVPLPFLFYALRLIVMTSGRPLPDFSDEDRGAAEFLASACTITRTRTKNAPRERDSMSSLPGLTRQSMLTAGSLVFAARFCSLHFSMDHRVKPGGDEVRAIVAGLS